MEKECSHPCKHYYFVPDVYLEYVQCVRQDARTVHHTAVALPALEAVLGVGFPVPFFGVSVGTLVLSWLLSLAFQV